MSKKSLILSSGYGRLAMGIRDLLTTARRASARAVNAFMTATYWEIGRRIVEFEQGGKAKAGYGEALIQRLSQDLMARFGRGFSEQNLERMRLFYQTQDAASISSTPSRKSTAALAKPPLSLSEITAKFPLSWSHYVGLLAVKSPEARKFYETEALRGGWSVRQLNRQVSTLFYERTALSKNKTAMLTQGAKAKPEDVVTPEEEVKDPCVLEFLGLKDEYSESQLEEALIRHLESFLMELGGDFAFVGRQKRLRIGESWFRVDLVFFHRQLRSLMLVDLKVGEFTPADAGQIQLYLNYAKAHWMREGENPPVGLILCARQDRAVAKYALDGLPNQVLAREYHLALPAEELLAAEIEKTRKTLSARPRGSPRARIRAR